MPSINPFLCIKTMLWPGEWIRLARKAKHQRQRKRDAEKPEFADYTIFYCHADKTWKTILRSESSGKGSGKSSGVSTPSGGSSFAKVED